MEFYGREWEREREREREVNYMKVTCDILFSACDDFFRTTEGGTHRAIFSSDQVVRFKVGITAGMRRFPLDVMLRWAPCHSISASRNDNFPSFSPFAPHTHTRHVDWFGCPGVTAATDFWQLSTTETWIDWRRSACQVRARYTFRLRSSLQNVLRSNSRATSMTMAPYDSVLSARTFFSSLAWQLLRRKSAFFNLHHELNCRILLVEVAQSCCNAKCSMVDAIFSHAKGIVTNEEQKQAAAEFAKIKQELLAKNLLLFLHTMKDNRKKTTSLKERSKLVLSCLAIGEAVA